MKTTEQTSAAKHAATIKKLIELSRAIVASKGDSSLILAEYLNQLEEFESFSAELASGKSDKSLKPSVKELVSLHQAVIQKIEDEKDEVKKRLLSLRKKGKAVIKYTDHLPKSISLNTRKKI